MKCKLFHGPVHDVEDAFNGWIETSKLKILETKLEVAGLKSWSMDSQMAFVVLFVLYEES